MFPHSPPMTAADLRLGPPPTRSNTWSKGARGATDPIRDGETVNTENGAGHSSWELSFGAKIQSEGVRFRVWAPRARTVSVDLQAEGPGHEMERDEHGVFSLVIPGIEAGQRYKYLIDDQALPDPYSRRQPDGVHGVSQVVDPNAFEWQTRDWPGLDASSLVIYECHVGTMTPEGTFRALAAQIPELKRLGITALELMPVAQFAGQRNWGYDGVDLFAPASAYGEPDDLRYLVDAAHQAGIGVILDVVYNHLGPEGNYLRAFAPQYFTSRHKTPWGEALNFDGDDSRFVREFVIDNALYWLHEFRIDGLRLDATHHILDDSDCHILAALSDRARASVGDRKIVLIAENDQNDVKLLAPTTDGGRGMDAVWADGFHHSVRVFLTGEREGYYRDYAGTTEEIALALNEGFIFQGQFSRHLRRRRGTKVTDQPGRQFVFTIQNHDQIGNRAFGERLNHQVSRAAYRVASTVLLTAPETPLLFMGQEFAASSPFQFFTDFEPELGEKVTTGRRKEFKAFSAFRDAEKRDEIPDPQDVATFERSKLVLEERENHADVYRFYQGLVALRTRDVVLRVPDRSSTRSIGLQNQVLVVHRWNGEEHRLMVFNFGDGAAIDLTAHEFFTQLPDRDWRMLFSSNLTEYGGSGLEARQYRRGPVHRLEVPAHGAYVFAGRARRGRRAGSDVSEVTETTGNLESSATAATEITPSEEMSQSAEPQARVARPDSGPEGYPRAARPPRPPARGRPPAPEDMPGPRRPAGPHGRAAGPRPPMPGRPLRDQRPPFDDRGPDERRRGASRPPPTPGRRPGGPPAPGGRFSEPGDQRDSGQRPAHGAPRPPLGGQSRSRPAGGDRGLPGGRPPGPGSRDVWNRGPGGNLGPWRQPPAGGPSTGRERPGDRHGRGPRPFGPGEGGPGRGPGRGPGFGPPGERGEGPSGPPSRGPGGPPRRGPGGPPGPTGSGRPWRGPGPEGPPRRGPGGPSGPSGRGPGGPSGPSRGGPGGGPRRGHPPPRRP
jgi:maltooligosyltrehalose trehalohydrolase